MDYIIKIETILICNNFRPNGRAKSQTSPRSLFLSIQPSSWKERSGPGWDQDGPSWPPCVQERKFSPKRKFLAGYPCGHPAKNFGQALQILEKKNKHFGTDIPRGRPRKNFGLKNFGLIFRSLIFWPGSVPIRRPRMPGRRMSGTSRRFPRHFLDCAFP